jgi:hypothetical protein
MRKTFLQTLRDETLRIELGPAVLSDLAVENLELSTSERSQAVRQNVIGRRRAGARSVLADALATANLLAMHEVKLVDAPASVGPALAA